MTKPTRSYDVYIDGASHGNPGPAGIGVVFLEPAADGSANGTAKPVREVSRPIGHATNNVAEYLALLYALQEALGQGWTALRVRSDSELLVRQINGQYKVKDAALRMFYDLVMNLTGKFTTFSIEHIPRTQNAHADRLAGQAAKQSGARL